MRRLFLCPVEDGFDPVRDAVIGPWSFIGREDRHPGWEDLPYEDAVTDADALLRHAVAARRVADDLVPVFARRLNEQHGRHYSDAYWRVLLIPWLLALSQVAWKRYLAVSGFISRNGNETFAVPVALDADWRFADTVDFAERGLIGHAFNFWLSSKIVERLAPSHWSLTPVSLDPPPEKTARNQPATARGVLRRALGRLRFSGVTGAGPWTSLMFSAWLALRPASRASEPGPSSAETGDIDPVPEDFVDMLTELAEATLPECFEADFAIRERRARAYRYRRCRTFVRGCVLWYDEEEKFSAAHALEAGERLITVQHGGNYGIAKSFPDAAEIEYRHHAFVSWGWERQTRHDGNFITLPSPHLSRFRNRYRRETDDLILVGTQQRLFSYRLDSSPQPSQWLDYRCQKSRFIDSLDGNPRDALVYRPGQAESATLSDAEWLAARHPGLPVLEGALHPKMLRCRLLVLDHPGTTLNIAMAANIPTICYWREAAWPACPEATPNFERFRELGMLFEHGDRAGAKINEVWEDIDGWWRRPEIQAARESFCSSYARTAPHWWAQWLRTI